MTTMDLLPKLDRQRYDFAVRWRREQCVAVACGSSNAAILHREFENWSGFDCTLEEFVAALGRLGFELDADGMIAGLILREDFAAATTYERVRLV